jgi:hypothetical protein
MTTLLLNPKFLCFGRMTRMRSTKLFIIYKLAAIAASIVIAGAIGVCIPILGKTTWRLPSEKGILIHDDIIAILQKLRKKS